MHMYSPTHQQRKLLGVITVHIEKTGESPTYREMQAAMGQKSTNNIHRLVRQLEDRGQLRRSPHQHRGLQVLQAPLESYYVVVRENDEAKLVPMERA